MSVVGRVQLRQVLHAVPWGHHSMDGVGCFRKLPLFLKPGDTVTCAIDGIGSITNTVVADGSDHDGLRSPITITLLKRFFS